MRWPNVRLVILENMPQNNQDICYASIWIVSGLPLMWLFSFLAWAWFFIHRCCPLLVFCCLLWAWLCWYLLAWPWVPKRYSIQQSKRIFLWCYSFLFRVLESDVFRFFLMEKNSHYPYGHIAGPTDVSSTVTVIISLWDHSWLIKISPPSTTITKVSYFMFV